MNDDTIKVILENIEKQVIDINKKFDEFKKDISCKLEDITSDLVRHDTIISQIKERNDKKDAEILTIIAKNQVEHEIMGEKVNKLVIKDAKLVGATGVIAFIAQWLFKIISDRL